MESCSGVVSLLIIVLVVLLFNCSTTSSRSLNVERVCRYENMTIAAGRRFHPEPCMTCSCSRHGGRVTCSIKDCQSEMNCLKFDKNSRSCCPRCLEYGCAHTDGKVYRKGATIVDTDCISCYCPEKGGETVCDVTPCEAVACDNPKKKVGECCPYCESDLSDGPSRPRLFG